MVANLKLKGIDGGLLLLSISRGCTSAAGRSGYTEKMTVNCKKGISFNAGTTSCVGCVTRFGDVLCT